MPRNLAPAALGFRVHSGWAAVVAVSGPLTSPAVTERRRIEIAAPEIAGSKQPYHAVKNLELKEAERFLLRCNESSFSLAAKAIGDCIHDANSKGQKIARCGILLGSGRPLGTLAAILASHALIHTADGELFREALLHASRRCGVETFTAKESGLVETASEALGLGAEELPRRLADLGAEFGPPWTQDEKLAALVAWLSLLSR